MKSILIMILMIGLLLAGYSYFIASDTTGVWGDGKKIEQKKTNAITGKLAPAPG
jgi:hypothetical protein